MLLPGSYLKNQRQVTQPGMSHNLLFWHRKELHKKSKFVIEARNSLLAFGVSVTCRSCSGRSLARKCNFNLRTYTEFSTFVFFRLSHILAICPRLPCHCSFLSLSVIVLENLFLLPTGAKFRHFGDFLRPKKNLHTHLWLANTRTLWSKFFDEKLWQILTVETLFFIVGLFQHSVLDGSLKGQRATAHLQHGR